MPAELDATCILKRDAVENGDPNSTIFHGCPAAVGPVVGTEDWLPEGVGEDWIGYINERATIDAELANSNPPRCCYDWGTVFFTPGRPLLDARQTPRTAAPISQSWSEIRAEIIPVGRALSNYLARAWLRDALAEHASIASFARTTLELLAIGAPRDLIRDAQSAGLDEVRHADRCFELAAAYAGEPLGPGLLDSPPPRAPELVRLAVDTFLEGCVGETVAALGATRALSDCKVPVIQATLKMIARDEAEHAALAWRTIAWTVRTGGEPVRNALSIAAETATLTPAPRDLTSGQCETLRIHGRLDPTAKHRVERDAWREIIRPTLQPMLSG